jgi:hypothetical protein
MDKLHEHTDVRLPIERNETQLAFYALAKRAPEIARYHGEEK